MLLTTLAASVLSAILWHGAPSAADLGASLYCFDTVAGCTEAIPGGKHGLIIRKSVLTPITVWADVKLQEHHSHLLWPYRIISVGFYGYLTYHAFSIKPVPPSPLAWRQR